MSINWLRGFQERELSIASFGFRKNNSQLIVFYLTQNVKESLQHIVCLKTILVVAKFGQIKLKSEGKCSKITLEI